MIKMHNEALFLHRHIIKEVKAAWFRHKSFTKFPDGPRENLHACSEGGQERSAS